MVLHPFRNIYFEFRQLCTSHVFDELLQCHVFSYNSLASVLTLAVFSTKKTMLKLGLSAFATTQTLLKLQKKYLHIT